jgi:hypothetical protein
VLLAPEKGTVALVGIELRGHPGGGAHCAAGAGGEPRAPRPVLDHLVRLRRLRCERRTDLVPDGIERLACEELAADDQTAGLEVTLERRLRGCAIRAFV